MNFLDKTGLLYFWGKIKTLINNSFAANDVMTFKGTIGTGGTATALPATHKVGDTYKVSTAGTYAGAKCEIGDMIICVKDGSAGTASDWTIVQSNIDGAVTGPTSSTDAHVAVFNGATGKIIKDSGFTIAKSVPSNAVFTDTTYSVATTSKDGLMSAKDKKKLEGIIGNGDYVLPAATSTTLGGVKVGEGLNIDGEGVLSSTGSGVGKVDSQQDIEGLIVYGEIFNVLEGSVKNIASGLGSHAEGSGTTASGRYSHAEGCTTTASGDYGSHAEGCMTTASGDYGSHAEGYMTTASGDYGSHAEGCMTTASGDYGSHAEGYMTTANNDHEHAEGIYNKSNSGETSADKTQHSIGIGTGINDRKNAVEVMLNGDVYINGVGGYDGTNYAEAQTLQASLFEPITIDVTSLISDEDSYNLFHNIFKKVIDTNLKNGIVYFVENGQGWGTLNFFRTNSYEDTNVNNPTINFNGQINLFKCGGTIDSFYTDNSEYTRSTGNFCYGYYSLNASSGKIDVLRLVALDDCHFTLILDL